MEKLFVARSRISVLRDIIVLLLVLGSPAAAFDAEEQMLFADGLYARGMYEMAMTEYLALAREAPSFEKLDIVLYRIGECYRRQENVAAADRFYLRVSREYGDSAYALRADFRRAELFITTGKYLDAVNLFRALTARNPPADIAAGAEYYRGYASKRLLLLADAEQAFRSVMERYPDSPFASYAALELGDLYKDEQDRKGDVEDLYRQAAEKPATAAVGAEAVFQLAERKFREGAYDESAEAYARLLKEYAGESRAREAKLQAAWAFHHAGRHADALTLCEEALKDKERRHEESDWLYLAANCRRQLQQTDEARHAYRQLIDKYPRGRLAPLASYELALISFRDEQFDEAIREAEKIKPAPEIEIDLHWLLAESHAALDRHAEAEKQYRAIIDQFAESPQAPKAMYRLGRLLQKRGEYKEASQLLRRLAKDHPKDDTAPHALFSSAFCRVMADEYKEAVKDWEQLLKSYPKSELVEETQYQLALARIQLDQDKPALAALDDFLKTYPKSVFGAEAHYWRSILLDKAGRMDDAERALREASKRKPDKGLDEKIRFRLAMILQRQDQPDEAAHLIQELLGTPARENMPPSLLEWLAVHRLREEKFSDASRAAEELIAMADTPAWRQIGYYLLGRGRTGEKRDNEALKAFEQSLNEDARTREGADAALYLGELNRKKKKYEEAGVYLERAAELASEPDLMDIRARSYYGLGQVAQAKKDWDRAARYYMSVGILFDDPELTPECLYQAAQAFGESGEDKKKRDTLAELSKRYPESSWARKIDGGTEDRHVDGK